MIRAKNIEDGTVVAAEIANDSIDSQHYAAGSIDAEHLANDSIDSQHYVDGSIDTAHLAADAVTGAKVADDQIDSEHYVAGSVDAEHLASSAVTLAKVANNVLDLTKVGDAIASGATSGSGFLGFAFAQTVSGTTTYAPMSDTFNIRIIDAHVVMRVAGASSDTVKLTDSSSDITDTLDLSAESDTDIVRFTQIDDAYHTLAANSLRVVTASDALCDVYITFARVT